MEEIYCPSLAASSKVILHGQMNRGSQVRTRNPHVPSHCYRVSSMESLGFLTYRPNISLELVLSENRCTGPGPRSRAPHHDALGGLVHGCGVSPRCLEPARWAPGFEELKILPPAEKHKSTAPLPRPKSDHSHRAQRKICINSMNKAGEEVSPCQASVGPPV